MANVSWTGNTGSWTDGADWNTGTEPGSADVAIFSTGSTYTVTYDTSDSIAQLEDNDSGATLAFTGGSLGLLNTLGNSYWNGVIAQSGGTIAVDLGTFSDNASGGPFAFTGGTDQVAAGAEFYTANLSSLDGTLAGAGEFFINAGSATVAATAALLVGTLDLNSGTLVLGGNNSYAGKLFQGGGESLDLNGNTLTLSGRSFLDGYIVGPGALDVTGTADLATAYIKTGAVLDDTGVITQDSYIYLGGSSGDSGTIDIATTGDYKLLNDSNINVDSTGTIVNAGTFEKTGVSSTSNIYAGLDSTGTLAVDAGTLVLTGGSNTLDGLITGAGELYIASGATVTLEPTATLDVGTIQIQGGGDLVLAGTTISDTYAGTSFASAGGTINTDGNALTLTGSGSVDGYLIGGGTLDLAGSFEDSGVYLAGQSTELLVTGYVSQSGYIQLGTISTDKTTLDIASTGTYAILNDFQEIGTVGAATIDNAGLLEKLSANQYTLIYPGLTNTGTLDIASGTLALEGGANALGGLIEGGGQLYIGSGATATLAPTTTLTVGALQIQGGGDFVLGGTTVTDTYAGTVFANSNATINTAGSTLTLTGGGSIDSYLIGGGTLDLAGSFEDAGVYLAGSHTELLVTGNVTQSGYIQLGTTSTDSTTLDIASGATYAILNDFENIGTSGAATIDNAGLLEKLGATAYTLIYPGVTSTGTLDIASGTLALEGGLNALSGIIEGAGQLYIGSGAKVTLAPTATFDVASLQIQGGGDFVLGGTTATSETFAGLVFANVDATINTNGSTLTLTGGGSIDSYLIGGGTLDLAGSFEDGGVYLAGSHTELVVTGSVTQSSYVQLGTTATDSTTFDIASGATYDLLFDGTAIGTVGGATILNAGLIEKTAAYGDSYIEAPVVNTGTVDAITGTIEVAAAVTNDGLLEAGGGLGAGPSEIRIDGSLSGTGAIAVLSGGTVDFAGSVASGQTITLSGSGDLAYIGAPGSFHGTIDGFTTGDTIDLAGIQGTAFTYNGTILTVGSASIDLPGLTSASIALYSDGSSGTDVEYTPSTPAFSYLSASATTDTWTGTAGDSQWSTAGNWSAGLPGTVDNVSISSAGTITFDTTATINVLDVGSSQIDITGGTLQVDDSGSASSSTIDQSAGTLDMVNGFAADGFAYTLAAGAVGLVDNGTWWIDGGSLDGSLGGSGAIELIGTTTLGSSLAPGVGTLILAGNETLESNLSYAGVFELIGGTLDLNGFTLTLSGTHGQLDGTFTDGEIIETGSADATILPLDGTTTLDDAGLLTQNGAAYLYGGGSLTIAAGATYDILGDYAINNNSTIGTVDNSGLFEKTAATGISYIYQTLDNAAGATLDAASGTIALQDGGVFAGNLIGAGELEFGGGGTLDVAIPAVATLGLENSGGLLTLGTSVTYAGTLDFGYAVGVDLAGNNLTLTGTDDYVQNGFTNTSATVSTVDVAAGATLYDGDVFVYPSVELDDFGTVLQDRANNIGITLQDSLVIEHGATYDLISDAGIYDNSTLGTISNLGLFEKTTTTGSSTVQAAFDNAGTATLDVASGTITLADGGTFAGNIIGAGELEFSGGGTLDDATPTVGTLVQADGGGTLTLGTSVTYAGSLYLGISEDVDLAGNNLTLTGTNDFLRNGFINSGASVSTVDVAVGATAYDGDMFVNPSIELDVFGTVLQQAQNNNGITLQGSMVLETGGTYDLISDANINNNGTVGTIDNTGLFEKTDAEGTSTVSSVFDNAGTATLDAVRGIIALEDGGTLGGTLAGNELDLAGSGTYTLDAGTDLTGLATLAIASTSATLELLGNTTFAGTLLDSGVIDLNGNTLTLTGTADSLSGYVEGPGEIIIAGGTNFHGLTIGAATAYESSLELYGTATQDVAGLVVQDVQGTLGSGAGDNSLLSIAPGGTYDIINDYGLSGFGTVDNAGTFEKTGVTGTSNIAVSFTNTATGVVLASDGTLSLGTLENASSGTLAGGTYEASGGGGIAGTLDLSGSLTTDGAAIILSGPGSEIFAGGTPIEQQLTMVDAGGSLELENGHSYVTANTITDSGLISLAGGLFDAASLDITGTGSLSGYGTVTAPTTNDGVITAPSSIPTSIIVFGVDDPIIISPTASPPLLITTPISGTGELVADDDATLELGSSVASTETLMVAPGGDAKIDDPAGFTSGTILDLDPGATLDFGAATVTSASIAGGSLDIVVGGTSLAYALITPDPLDRPAIIANSSSGDDVVIYGIAQASSVTPNPVAYGEQHVGTTVSQALTIANADLPYEENLDASFSASSGGVTGTGTVTGLTPGATSTALGLALDTAADGTVAGAATLALSSDGTGVDGNPPLLIGTQTITGTGTLFNYATASPVAPNPVALGELHTGTPVTQVFTIANTATADGFSENLDGAFTGASAGITASGTVSELGAGSSSTGLDATIDLTADGAFTGAATLGLISDGSTIDTLGTTALASQTIGVSSTVFNYATAAISPSPLALGEYHVGDVVTQSLTIANTAPMDGFSENLDASFTSSGSITGSGGVSELAAGTSIASAPLTLDTTNAGSLSGFVTIGLISDGSTIDTLGTTALPTQTIAASGEVFNLATAAVPSSIDFGIVHVGDTVDQAITIANAASPDGFSENLDATAGSAATGFTLAGTDDEIAAGSSDDALTVTLDTAAAGTFSGDGTIGLVSDGSTIDTLGTTALPGATISLDGLVLNYATAAIDEISGSGTFSGSGATGYTLDLGTLTPASGTQTADLGVLNAALGPADTLSGSFDLSGSGFTTTGFGPFSDITAGNSADAGTISFASVNLGTYFETITLDPTGYDAAPYSAALPAETVLVEADVACFAAGTRIATLGGEAAVEELRIGDMIATAAGAARPIRWIGRRSYSGRFVAGNRHVLPILIGAGALGDNLPRRDLLVSPNHAMYLDGVLIPAIELVNGASIRQLESVEAVAYFHIELETHDIILAEGAPAESFIDDDSRGMFHNAAEFRELYAEAAPAAARYCAPRIEHGEALEAVRRRLAARAAEAIAAASRLDGYLDAADHERIVGWARDPAAPDRPVRLVVLDNGVAIAEVVANGYRADLAEGGFGDGRLGFDLKLPDVLSPHLRHVIRVERVEDGAELQLSPRIIEPAADAAPLALTAPAEPSRAWQGQLDSVSRDRIRGWAWEPEADGPVSLQIIDNGRPIARVVANLYRPDLEQAGIGRGRHAFDVLIPGGLSPLVRHVIEVRREPDGAMLPGAPAVIAEANSFDASLEQAVAGAVAATVSSGEHAQVLSFLMTQADRLLQLRADADGERNERAVYRQLCRRWGPQAETHGAVDPGRRALVIDARMPAENRDAGSRALLSHMRALCRLGYAVSFTAADEMAKPGDALAAEGIACCGAPFYASVEDVLRRQAECFDVVYMHRATIAERYLALARTYLPRARLLYSVADLHWLRLERQAVVEARPELLAASRRLRFVECTAAWLADAVITHSAQEAQLLRAAVPAARVHCVPWEVPLAAAGTRFAARRGVAFVAHYAHAPNQDAAYWLVEEIMPLVWNAAPEIGCVLVGSDMPEGIRRLSGPAVTVLGQIADLGEVYDRVRLTAAPLRYGAGVKGKVLESLAAGLPCVMSPAAAEGMALPASLRALIGSDPAQLAALICRMHADAAAHAAAAAAGLAFVQEQHDAASVDTALRAAIDDHSPRVRQRPAAHPLAAIG